MGIFDKIIDKSYRINFWQYKKERMPDDDIREFTEQYILSEQCEEDISRLKNGDYYFSIPTMKLVPKSDSDKKRILYLFPKNEVAVMRLIAYALQNMDELYSDELYSFRFMKGAKEYAQIRKAKPDFDKYYAVKADIKSYANTMNVELLVNKIKSIFSDDPQLSNFLSWFLERRQYIYRGQVFQGDTAGLPGCPLYGFFSNIYLTDVDSYFQKKGIQYARYADDILIYAKTKEEAEQDYADLRKLVEGLKLHFNEKKTGILDAGEPVEFLGVLYGDGWIDISHHTLEKIKRKMRGRAKRIEQEKRMKGLSSDETGKLMIWLGQNVFTGKEENNRINWIRWFFPVITRADGLMELDRYNQYCIRYAMTGKWNKAQYKVSYEKLKELGYKSLVRMYYAGSAIEQQGRSK